MKEKRVFYSEIAYFVSIIVCTVFNGRLIGRISKILENNFSFKDALPANSFFKS